MNILTIIQSLTQIISASRSQEQPQPGDQIHYTDKYGTYYTATVTATNSKKCTICLHTDQAILTIPVATEKEKLQCTCVGGPMIKIPAKGITYKGPTIQPFTYTSPKVTFPYHAQVNTWEYNEPDPLYPGFTTKEWYRYTIKPATSLDTHGNYIRYYTNRGINFKDEKELIDFAARHRGTLFHSPIPEEYILWAYHFTRRRISREDFDTIDSPTYNRSNNDTRSVKFQYDHPAKSYSLFNKRRRKMIHTDHLFITSFYIHRNSQEPPPICSICKREIAHGAIVKISDQVQTIHIRYAERIRPFATNIEEAYQKYKTADKLRKLFAPYTNSPEHSLKITHTYTGRIKICGLRADQEKETRYHEKTLLFTYLPDRVPFIQNPEMNGYIPVTTEKEYEEYGELRYDQDFDPITIKSHGYKIRIHYLRTEYPHPHIPGRYRTKYNFTLEIYEGRQLLFSDDRVPHDFIPYRIANKINQLHFEKYHAADNR